MTTFAQSSRDSRTPRAQEVSSERLGPALANRGDSRLGNTGFGELGNMAQLKDQSNLVNGSPKVLGTIQLQKMYDESQLSNLGCCPIGPKRTDLITTQGFAAIQRIIRLKEGDYEYEDLPTALEDAEPATKPSESEEEPDLSTVARVRVRNLFYSPEAFLFDDKKDYALRIAEFTEAFVKRVDAFGLQGDELSKFLRMHRGLEKADPSQDEAAIHKLAEPYDELMGIWKNKVGVGKVLEKELQYRPGSSGHTMPLNFAWLAAVAHNQVPVRVIVPITERALVRPKSHGETIDMERVRSGEDEAPLSATAREILGLLRGEFYQPKVEEVSSSYEVLLRPTGKILDDPSDVLVAEKMKLETLYSYLSSRGIEIKQNAIIDEIISQLPKPESVSMVGSSNSQVGELFPQYAQTGPNWGRIFLVLTVAALAVYAGKKGWDRWGKK